MSGEGSSHDAGNFFMSLIMLLDFFPFPKWQILGRRVGTCDVHLIKFAIEKVKGT